ncbi:TraX family protein [Streptococcus porcinus]|uniref:TraX family protein n=1 Tax=Streptococcus porcinus TaxID=1340 RepID=UPI0010CAD27E|nr:TraX family protein [Streptococcus porcinus]VTS17099.1 TraX family protein [Streptococcus porcinus]
MKKMTALHIKIVALIFMLIDHINTFFGHQLGFPQWFHWLGRFVAPVFLYLLMEGFKYTKSRKQYLKRLFIASMIMHMINIVRSVLTKGYINSYTKEFDAFGLIAGNNIFWTLFLMLSLFILLDKVKNGEGLRGKKWIVAIILMLPLILFAEGGFYLLPIAFACFFFNNNAKKVSVSVFIWSMILLSKTLFNYVDGGNQVMSLYQQLTYSSEFLMMTSIPFILAYNGKRGGSGKKWEKNLFYVFYPLHLVIIYSLSIIFNLF